MFIWKKLLKYQYMENVTDIVFFMVCKIYFPLVLSKRWIRREYTDAMQKGSVGFEGNIRTPCKKVLRQPYNLTLQVSLSLRDK